MYIWANWFSLSQLRLGLGRLGFYFRGPLQLLNWPRLDIWKHKCFLFVFTLLAFCILSFLYFFYCYLKSYVSLFPATMNQLLTNDQDWLDNVLYIFDRYMYMHGAKAWILWSSYHSTNASHKTLLLSVTTQLFPDMSITYTNQFKP